MKKFFYFGILFNIVFVTIAKDCDLDIRKIFPEERNERRAPLLINPYEESDSQIFPALKNDVRVFYGQRIDVVCKNEYWRSACDNGKIVDALTGAPLDSFSCSNELISSERIAGSSNSEDVEFEIGFQTTYYNNFIDGFISVLKGVYNKNTNVTQYITYKMSRNTNDLQPCSIDSSNADHRFSNNLHWGQLVTLDDFPYCHQKIASMHGLNSILKCTDCYRESWPLVEQFIQEETLEGCQNCDKIIAGTYGSERLNTGEYVPKYIFKIVPSIGYAFIAKNHKEDEYLQPFCTNQCYKLKSLKKFSKGENDFIFCCTIDEFIRTVNFWPSLKDSIM